MGATPGEAAEPTPGYYRELGIDAARTRARLAREAGKEAEALAHEAEVARLEALDAAEEAASQADIEAFRIAKGVPLGRGSTADLTKGTTLPRSLQEQLAVKAAQAAPRAGEQITRITMTDARWPATEGWVKMQQHVISGGGERFTVHYVMNTITNAIDDFKIVVAAPR